MRSFVRRTLAALAFIGLSSAAQAATLTFNTAFNGTTYTEGAATIAAQSGSVNVNTTGSALGFNCCAGAFTANWLLTTGGLFDLVSIDVLHVDSPDPVTFTGLLNGLAVAAATFTSSIGAYNFDGFEGVDSVLISINSVQFGDPRFDNLVYEAAAPIPLPATMPLLAAALAGLAFARRRRT